jgi:SAM-dependent methyltransferase
MLIQKNEQAALNAFLQTIKLQNHQNQTGKDKTAKIEQILAYLEVMHAQLRKYSRKRTLVLIESGAGNCYLSFLVYYFYTRLDNRRVAVDCLDINVRLMQKARELAQTLGFDGMTFHACDIADYRHATDRVDMVYSLHACDSATDKALYLGLRNQARSILSVSCCQHTLKKRLKGHPYRGITRHRVFKDMMVYMVGDSLRALLLEMQGYKVDILEFVSSRHTDKNIMMRAQRGHVKDTDTLKQEYEALRTMFHVSPSLEYYLEQGA